MTETVTQTSDEYVALAVQLAQSSADLMRLRETLRPALVRSAFCDAERLVTTLALAYRGMRRSWCESSRL